MYIYAGQMLEVIFAALPLLVKWSSQSSQMQLPLPLMLILLLALLTSHRCHDLQAMEEEGGQMDELVSAPKMVLQGFIRNWFPEEAPEGMAPKQLDALLVQVRHLRA